MYWTVEEKDILTKKYNELYDDNNRNEIIREVLPYLPNRTIEAIDVKIRRMIASGLLEPQEPIVLSDNIVKRDRLEKIKELASMYKPIDYQSQPDHNINITLPLEAILRDDKIPIALSFAVSDLHLGHVNHLPRTYWSMVANLKRIIGYLSNKFLIMRFSIITNGDIVSGANVYRGHEWDNIVPRTHWQVSLAAKVFNDTRKELSDYVELDKYHIIRGTHDSRGNNHAIQLQKELGIENAVYHGDKAILNVADPIGYFNILFTHGKGSCLDIKTKIMTEDGFKGIDEISTSDLVATIDGNGTMIYQHPTKIIIQEYYGNLIHWEGRSYDLMLTPNHKMLVEYNPKCEWREAKRKKIRWVLTEAEELYDNFISGKWRMREDQRWDGEEIDYFEVPYYSKKGYESRTKHLGRIKIETWMKFLGLFLAEGYTTNTEKDIGISQSKERYYEEVKNVLYEIGLSFRYNEEKRTFIIHNMELAKYLRKNIGTRSNNKRIPKEFKRLSSRLISILLSYYGMGDGSKSRFVRYDYECFVTTSKQLAEDLVECLMKIGLSGNISFVDESIRTVVDTKRFCKKSYVVNIKGKNLRPGLHQKPKLVPYMGRVWCVTVPNHIICVMRNGKVSWTGNSDYSPVSPSMTREILLLLAQTKVPVERVCLAHTHNLTVGLCKTSVVYDVLGGYQRYDPKLSRRPCGSILYLYCLNGLSVIPVFPDEKIMNEERDDHSLEWSNSSYYSKKLLEYKESGYK